MVRLIVVTYLPTFRTIQLRFTTTALPVALPATLAWLPLSGSISFIVRAGGWRLFFAVTTFALGVPYRHGPSRRSARRRAPG